MWQIICGLAAVDRGMSSYEYFERCRHNTHNAVKGCLNLAMMCGFVCCMFGNVKWGRALFGKPPKK